jgi:ABC-2 type transport system ATP-binding protein
MKGILAEPSPRLATGSSEAIVVTDLVKTYRGDVRALDGLTFAVEAGTIFGLLGPNGAGKSTTVRILTTLTRPDAGNALVAGRDVAGDPAGVRRIVGSVGQRAAVDPDATGRENLALQARLYGLGGADLRRRSSELLDRFGLSSAADRVVRTYSGGMQRKLHVAMGLVHGPEVIFLDEPTTGLDPEARSELWTEIGRLVHEDGLTILMTTHYLEEADRLAGRLAIVDRGRVIAEGTPDELKAELRGDAVTVELAIDDDERATSALLRVSALTGIREPALDGRSLRARADHGASAVPAVLGALDAVGIGVVSVTVARPSLDDVYLRHTGRAFRQHAEEVAA